MVTKDYKCNRCGEVYEITHSIKDKPPKCSESQPGMLIMCGGELEWIPKVNKNETLFFSRPGHGARSQRIL